MLSVLGFEAFIWAVPLKTLTASNGIRCSMNLLLQHSRRIGKDNVVVGENKLTFIGEADPCVIGILRICLL